MAEIDEDTEFEIAEYCARLSCKKLIVQTPGRGRRREYCSETCRRGADREYKRAKNLVEHFERVLRKTRYEVAAYGRNGEDEMLETVDAAAHRQATARSAVSRAQGVLQYTSEVEDRFRDELRMLVEAVEPLTSDPGADGVARSA
ncbi:hypothetical protein [Nocardioides conyzicola]